MQMGVGGVWFSGKKRYEDVMFNVISVTRGVGGGPISRKIALRNTWMAPKAMHDPSFGIEWGQKRLADLDFADDISAISHTLAGIQEITNNIETFGAKIGLRINCEKTKAMKIGPKQHPPILIMQQNVDYIKKFPYLGSYMSSNGDSEPDVRARIGKSGSIFQRLRPNNGHQLP